jgi:DDE superfamily endonuclease
MFYLCLVMNKHENTNIYCQIWLEGERIYFTNRPLLIENNMIKKWLLFNTDECGITLESSQLKQFSSVGSSFVQLKPLPSTVDLTKRFATVVLTVRGDGYDDKTKSKVWRPMVIFKGADGSNYSKKFHYDSRVIVEFSPNAWQNSHTWHQWAQNCAIGETCHQYLYLDNLKTHFTRHAIECFKQKNIIARHLLPRCTHLQQPIDQNIGHFIQQNVKKQYFLFKMSYQSSSESQRNLKKLTVENMRSLVCKWVGQAWEDAVNNHSHMLKSSWSNSGLLLDLSGDDDLEKLGPLFGITSHIGTLADD